MVVQRLRQTQGNSITGAAIVDGVLMLRRYDGSVINIDVEPVKVDAAEMMPLIGYGHSWVASALAASTRWLERVSERLHTPLVLRAQNGSTAEDLANTVIGTNAYEPGGRGLVIMETGAAEIRDATPWDTVPKAISIEENLRAAVLAVLGGPRDNVDGNAGWSLNDFWARGAGGWGANLTEPKASGGAWLYTTYPGDDAAKEFPAGTYVVALGSIAHDYMPGATVDILLDGEVVHTVDTDDATWDDTALGSGHIARLVTVPAGGGEIRIRKDDVDGTMMIVDYVAPLAPDPAQVVLVREVLGAKQVNDLAQAALDAAIADLNPAHVTVVDPRPGWNPDTMLGGDGIHPNDRGTAHLAEAVEKTLRALPWRDGMNLL